MKDDNRNLTLAILRQLERDPALRVALADSARRMPGEATDALRSLSQADVQHITQHLTGIAFFAE